MRSKRAIEEKDRMTNSKIIIVKKSERELKNRKRQQPIYKKKRVQMLLILRKTQKSSRKIELASISKVNHNTAQKWHMSYFEKAVNGLFFDERAGFKTSKINQEHHVIKKSLNAPKNAFPS